MIRLFVETYTDKDPLRNAELRACLAENLANPHIGSVHEIAFGRRATMGEALDFMRQHMGADDVGILANSDIAFDETLILLQGRRFPDTVLCVSRWEDGEPYAHSDSQDVWIFDGVPRSGVKAEFFFGIPGCDNRFAHELREVGYSLLNPCLNLRCHHRHTSGVRNYDDATPRLTGPIAHVHPCSL